MTDEKLNECSASTHGIYIKGIMCLMHKSETYGKILLKQKYKQTSSKEKNFALMLASHLPYKTDEIECALIELINEKVCHYEDDYLCQKRMIKDNMISEARSIAGKNGGIETQKNKSKPKKKFAKAKPKANSEYESEDDTVDEFVYGFESKQFKNFWNIWNKHLKAKRKDYKSIISEQAAMNKLVKLADGKESEAIELINHAVANNWQAFFPINNFNNGKGQATTKTGNQIAAERLAAKHVGFGNNGKQ